MTRSVSVVVALWIAAALPAAANDYPSVRELEAGLHLRPGVMLPKFIIARGRLWAARYLGATRSGRGIYTVRITLSPEGPR